MFATCFPVNFTKFLRTTLFRNTYDDEKMFEFSVTFTRSKFVFVSFHFARINISFP